MSNFEEKWKNFLKEDCQDGYERVPGSVEFEQGSCREISEETRDTYGSEVVDRNKRSIKKGSKKMGLEEKDDRCTRIAKRKYDVWPSAYASGAVVKCRDGKIWKGVSEGEEPGLEIKIRKALRDEGGAAGMDALVDHAEASEMEIKAAIKDMDDVGQHKNGDYILDDGEDVDILEDLRKWFKGGGWKQIGGKYDGKPCARQPGQKTKPKCASPAKAASMSEKERDNAAKRKRAQDPNPNRKGKAKNVNTDPKKESLDMKITKEQLKQIIFEETRQVYYEKIVREELDAVLDEKKKKKKKPCKPSKGKASAKRVDGKCRSYGQAGKAKDGGDRISRGTEKGDAYCARSAKIKKCKNPPCANALSRKAWGCQGDKSVA